MENHGTIACQAVVGPPNLLQNHSTLQAVLGDLPLHCQQRGTRIKQGQNKDNYILYILILLHLTSVFCPPGEPPHWGQSIKWEPTLGPRPWRSFLNAPSVPDWDLLLSCWDLHQDPRVSQRCYLKNIWNLTLYHIVPLYKQFQNCRLNSNPFDCMLVLMMWIDDLRPLIMSYYLRFCVRTLWSWQRCASERNQQKQRFNRATAHPVSTFLRLLWLGVTRPPSIALEGGRQLRQTKEFTTSYQLFKSFYCSFYVACFEVSICFSGRWLIFHKFLWISFCVSFHEFPTVDVYQDARCLCVPVPYLWPLPSDLKPPHLLCWKVCSPQIQITAVNATCNVLQHIKQAQTFQHLGIS